MPGPSQEYGFSLTSDLRAPPEEVWSHATRMQGVNREFFPLVRMTWPSSDGSLPSPPPLGQRLFRSWILLFGLLPIDYDDLTFVEFEPGRRFLERSVLFSQKQWIHERIVTPTATGCRLTDSVRFIPRLRPLGSLHLAVFRWAFHWRHRNLRRLFSRP
ncbi:SRPBCC family protein [Archangium violaceum]|uniref:SRPBCC family protein n=1 Tax=Archangium violaceum TaxID=83451 RepID=UPI00194E9BAD|nr:SRPBCC family protein [Archangium violaceum]QRN97067.1 SRPBCC family protein [Archangium violaceum]